MGGTGGGRRNVAANGDLVARESLVKGGPLTNVRDVATFAGHNSKVGKEGWLMIQAEEHWEAELKDE